VVLPLSQIHRNPDQPRRWFDEGALDKLASNIRQFGVLQPLVVRPLDDAYQLVAGERRWRAALRAGLEELPCTG
jgi:ParB family chromosome partitioning protein